MVKKRYWWRIKLWRYHIMAFNTWYQDECRIYLDEYPEQRLLRKNFLESKLLYKNRYGQESLILDGYRRGTTNEV